MKKEEMKRKKQKETEEFVKDVAEQEEFVRGDNFHKSIVEMTRRGFCQSKTRTRDDRKQEEQKAANEVMKRNGKRGTSQSWKGQEEFVKDELVKTKQDQQEEKRAVHEAVMKSNGTRGATSQRETTQHCAEQQVKDGKNKSKMNEEREKTRSTRQGWREQDGKNKEQTRATSQTWNRTQRVCERHREKTRQNGQEEHSSKMERMQKSLRATWEFVKARGTESS